jgi:hypothetical protein
MRRSDPTYRHTEKAGEKYGPASQGCSRAIPAVYTRLFDADEPQLMSAELNDLDDSDIDADADAVEHNSEVITAIRTAQQSQVQLNVLADQKANINIGFTLLFLSLSQSSMVADAATEGVMRWGVVLVIVLIAVSLTLALLVVSPRTHRLRIREPQQMDNPCYFGMFTQIDQDSYVDYMLTQLKQDKHARRMLLVDVYQIGRVLKRKYQLLRFSYAFLALSALLSAALFIYRTLSG